MKKIFGLLSFVVVVGIGCTKTSLTEQQELEATPAVTGNLSHRGCASEEVLQQQLKDDPTLASRMEAIEELTARYEQNPTSYRLVNGKIEIPVVVNVLYKTAAQNISQAQIQSQIDVLNADFSGNNTDINKVPATFTGVKAGDVGVYFVLAGVVRKATNKTSWSTNDAMKKGTQGGISPTTPSTTLNMWCCNMGGGSLGYAQFPGGSLATDGVVMDDNAFGKTGVTGPYTNGRTATHEVGHWLNLRHIWGDAQCGNDFVSDTPLHTGANYGCPATGATSSCAGTPIMMTMNYMDYTDDLCMYMFSAGQKGRMNATFAAGGGRNSFAQP